MYEICSLSHNRDDWIFINKSIKITNGVCHIWDDIQNEEKLSFETNIIKSFTLTVGFT